MAKEITNKPGTGVLFPRHGEGNQPNWSGGINIDGVEYELAQWDKIGKSGKLYKWLTVKLAQNQGGDFGGSGNNDPF